jgi:hypothetical protein
VDAMEETTALGIPYTLPCNHILYVPNFVPKHFHNDVTEEEMSSCT